MQLLIVVMLAGALWYWHRSRRLPPADRRRQFWRAVMLAGVVVLLFLVATGRLHVFAALGVVLVALLRRLPLLIKLWPIWRKLKAYLAASAPTTRTGAGQDTGPSQGQYRGRYPGQMTVEEAREILNVGPEADAVTIVQAHRRLMQKVHPDRGGKDGLAAHANEAKSRLLWELDRD